MNLFKIKLNLVLIEFIVALFISFSFIFTLYTAHSRSEQRDPGNQVLNNPFRRVINNSTKTTVPHFPPIPRGTTRRRASPE